MNNENQSDQVYIQDVSEKDVLYILELERKSSPPPWAYNGNDGTGNSVVTLSGIGKRRTTVCNVVGLTENAGLPYDIRNTGNFIAISRNHIVAICNDWIAMKKKIADLEDRVDSLEDIMYRSPRESMFGE